MPILGPQALCNAQTTLCQIRQIAATLTACDSSHAPTKPSAVCAFYKGVAGFAFL
jgi:hypothetical protein